ncbi:hypothetical protein PAAG_12021 [Paracoccidioides lutzii Pb01]|uniref:Uncharacterized protein n=1 Tax=Paracoccidioides lutzii (strain ATCC MYA-826 / Pb01) TaxID=502779 RepID=A0A0A2V0D9_PARBA|nr:hypothetical protein PAAG_12021 [Paracoccidioides lutzii Pb01]KGQ01251.1 hypothetical protein PAAG_12021 [Paracoccidioides lutzii Pb01]
MDKKGEPRPDVPNPPNANIIPSCQMWDICPFSSWFFVIVHTPPRIFTTLSPIPTTVLVYLDGDISYPASLAALRLYWAPESPQTDLGQIDYHSHTKV